MRIRVQITDNCHFEIELVQMLLNRTFEIEDIQSRKPYCFDFVYQSFNNNKNLFQVFHVRSVTQGDVIRADAKEIPRIFQVLVVS